MALTSIQVSSQDKAVFYFNRGDLGVLEDIQAEGVNEIQIPLITNEGGDIFIISE